MRTNPAAYVGDEFAHIAEMYPWVLEAQSAVSFYERRQKNHEKAIAAASRSVRLRPDFGPGYNTLAYAYLAAGKLDHAQAAMEKYRSLQPDDPNPYDSLGDLWMEAHEYKKAAENYFMAFQKDPNWIAGKEKAEEALKVWESSNN
jgi:tetratricopeptide (TPR) repeat protein